MDAPLVQPVESTPNVNPQLDSGITPPKERAKLNDSFSRFFSELDTSPAPPVEVPPEIPATEQPQESQPEKTPEVESVPEQPVKEVVEAKETAPVIPERDIESLELHSSASAEQKGQFKQLKEIAKTFRERNKAFETKLGPLLKDFGFELKDDPAEIAKTLEEASGKIRSLKTSALSPEASAELEQLRAFSRLVGITKDAEFISKYEKPLEKTYGDILDEIGKYLDAPEDQVKAFVEEMKSKHKPGTLDNKWWISTIESASKADPITKQRLIAKVAKLDDLREAYETKSTEIAADPKAYDKWQEQQREAMSRAYDAELRDEIDIAFKTDKAHLKPILPMPMDGVTDPEKLESIKQHNAAFQKIEQRFSDFLVNFHSGPRKAARAAMDYIEMEQKLPQLEKTLSDTESENKALKEEVTKLKAEVSKKRQVQDAPLKPTSGTGAKAAPEKAKLPLDARKSLDKAWKEWET